MEEVLILDFKDNEGKRFIFSKENVDNHSKYHPELKDKEYFKTIVNLIHNCEPDMIYDSYKQKNRYVYYEYIGRIGFIEWYNQVVVQKTKNLYIIITAYRFSGEIREKKYGGPLCRRP